METTGQPALPLGTVLSQAMDALWQKFLPEISERVATLELALTAAADGNLTPEQHEAAHAAAHKLAGVLGTFGLARGTELARELELAFAGKSFPDPDAITLAAFATELRKVVENRNVSS